MAKTKAICRKQELSSGTIFVVIAVVLCFSVAPEGSPASGAKDPNAPISILDRAHPAVRTQILTAAMKVFEPSLEMKENVDFVLTPALLAQEAISEGIVITYPSE